MIVNYIISVISLVILAVALLKLYPDYRVDTFRQQMFQLRDELFQYASTGHIEFNDPAHLMTRQMINGLIRFGHRLNLFEFFITLKLARQAHSRRKQLFVDQYKKNMDALSPAQREKLKSIQKQMNTAALEQLFLASPVFVLCLLPLLIPFTIVATVSNQLEQYKQRCFANIDDSAYTAGKSVPVS